MAPTLVEVVADNGGLGSCWGACVLLNRNGRRWKCHLRRWGKTENAWKYMWKYMEIQSLLQPNKKHLIHMEYGKHITICAHFVKGRPCRMHEHAISAWISFENCIKHMAFYQGCTTWIKPTWLPSSSFRSLFYPPPQNTWSPSNLAMFGMIPTVMARNTSYKY